MISLYLNSGPRASTSETWKLIKMYCNSSLHILHTEYFKSCVLLSLTSTADQTPRVPQAYVIPYYIYVCHWVSCEFVFVNKPVRVLCKRERVKVRCRVCMWTIVCLSSSPRLWTRVCCAHLCDRSIRDPSFSSTIEVESRSVEFISVNEASYSSDCHRCNDLYRCKVASLDLHPRINIELLGM